MPRVAVRVSVAAEVLSAMVEAGGDDGAGWAWRLGPEYERLWPPFLAVYGRAEAFRDAVLLEMGPDAPGHGAFAAFDRWLQQVPTEVWRRWGASAGHSGAPAGYGRGAPGLEGGEAARLVRDGAALRAHVRRMAAVVWEAVGAEWERAVPGLRRQAEARGRGPLPADAEVLLAAVTGFEPEPAVARTVAGADEIAFYPVLHNMGRASCAAGPDGRAVVVFEVGTRDAADPVPLLAAAGDAARWRVLVLLAERGPLSAEDVRALVGPEADRHLAVLAQAGLVGEQAVAGRRLHELNRDALRWAAARLEGLADGVIRP